jgi:hypothetical protein
VARQHGTAADDRQGKMTQVVRDPVMLFRFALRESDLSLAGGLAQLLRGKPTQQRLEQELAQARARSVPSLGALRAAARLTRTLGLGGRQG